MTTLEAMKRHGTVVRAFCQNPACKHWWDVDLDEMIGELGSDQATLWDRYPPCDKDCGGVAMFSASVGLGTPFRPMISRGLPPDAVLPIQSLMDGWIGIRR